MTFVKVDTGLMQALINNLNDRAHVVDTEKDFIGTESMNNSDGIVPPVEEVQDLTGNALTVVGVTSMHGAAESLRDVAEELSGRLQEVISLNSDGITVASPDGVMIYYLPDDGTVDTIENVRACNTGVTATAQTEAAELREAAQDPNPNINTSTHRPIDQILTDIDQHRDNPIYSAALIKAAGGPEGYLWLLISIDENTKVDQETREGSVTTMSHILAAASQPEVGGDQLGTDFGATVSNDTVGNETAAFNALTNQPEVVYGTGFLVNSADLLEDIEDIPPATSSYLITTYGTDPLSGVLIAMSNNPDAALEYLAPSDDGVIGTDGEWIPGQVAVNRWNMLTSRDQSNQFLRGFTAVVAAASSLRNRTPSPDDPVSPNADARATYASGKGIHYFASSKFSENDFTETMKENLAVVISNCPDEVAAAADGKSLDSADGPKLKKWDVDKTDISTLIYRFGDNKNAMATLATSMGEYHHRRIEKSMRNGGGVNGLEDEYQQVAASSEYIGTLSELRFEDEEKKDSDEQKTVVNTSLDILSTILVTGVTSLTDGAAIPVLELTTGSTILKPVVADKITGALGTSVDGDEDNISRSTALRAYSFADALNYGLFSKDSDEDGRRAIEAARGHDWYSEDSKGNPTIDSTSLTSDQAENMVTWKEDEVTNEDDLDVLGKLENAVSTGQSHGYEHAHESSSKDGPRRKDN